MRVFFTFEHLSNVPGLAFPCVDMPENCHRVDIVENIFVKYEFALKGVDQRTAELYFYNQQEGEYLLYALNCGYFGSENNTKIVLKYEKPDAAGKKHCLFYW